MRLSTSNLILKLGSPDDIAAMLENLSPEDRAELSPDWLAKVANAKEADPWLHGFSMFLAADDTEVGQCGFKGPPENGAVEIAYGVAPEFQGRGFATEAAERLVEFAFESSDVREVLAHTLPEANASTSVLTKCRFEFLGEVIDPEDGQVWRWRRTRDE